MEKALMQYTLRLGDTCLILGHRLSELCGFGPFLEEDIAISNIALDMIGRAELLYEYTAELEGEGRSVDDFIYRRNERQFFNYLLAERPNGHFGIVMMRQFLIDALFYPLFNAMRLSKDDHMAAIAEKAVKESNYHLQHSGDWLIRMGNGTDESKKKLMEALEELWMYTNEMFECGNEEKELSKNGTIPSCDEMKKLWMENVKATFLDAGLIFPEERWMTSGGREGIHSEYLGHLLAEMQFLPRAYPNDKW